MASVARNVHHAMGELDEHKRLRDVTSALEPGITTLIGKRKSQTLLSPEEESLLRVAEQCQDISKQIFHLLDSQTGPISQVGHKSPLSAKTNPTRLSTLKTFKVTLRILWRKREAEGLRQAFKMCTSQLNLHLTLISRSDILKKIEAVFAKSSSENSANVQNIRHTLQTTLMNISKKSDNIIKQINSVEFKHDQAVHNHSRWLEHISKLQNLFEASHLTLEEIKCHQVLKAIAFEGIGTRRHEIGNVELADDTFEWMVKDETVPASHQHLKQSFRSWLREGEGIFHISGKPGSGKSTMMNFLANHPETRIQLDKWARNGNRIFTASMFLWNPGSVQQKNKDGVCRTLLYTILKDHKELIPHVFAHLWNASSGEPLISQYHLELSRKDINAALNKLLTESTKGYQYCFFIDGLDEFQDENVCNFKLATELVRWASRQRVKMCLSSREEPPWMTHFDKFLKLELHFTTEQDIRRMIDNYLFDDHHLKTFGTVESEIFVSRFVDLANGVFIWVKLTHSIKSLTHFLKD
ncbi:hypothetical protein LZL87_013783 [Fusarium oxysporum]|nr:hypothetical protein LZL87_013783 [Fusarium oxysporum]